MTPPIDILAIAQQRHRDAQDAYYLGLGFGPDYGPRIAAMIAADQELDRVERLIENLRAAA